MIMIIRGVEMILLNSFLSFLLCFNMTSAVTAEDSNSSEEVITIVYGDEQVDLTSLDITDPMAVFNSNNQGVYITSDDIELMAKVVYGESGAEPYDGKVAVASVILNRVLSRNFPSTVKGVVTQRGAFSCVKNGHISVKPTKACYSAVYDALMGADPTDNSLFFYNPAIATCKWMHGVQKYNKIEIGNHVFFILK